jgi:hypothetical protein
MSAIDVVAGGNRVTLFFILDLNCVRQIGWAGGDCCPSLMF